MPCTSLPKVNLYITVLGGDFWKYLNGEFVFNVTIKIHYSFNVCRIPFSQLINCSMKIQDKNLPIHLNSESVYCIFDICAVWIGHNLLTSFISKLSQFTQANTHGEVAKIQPPWLLRSTHKMLADWIHLVNTSQFFRY